MTLLNLSAYYRRIPLPNLRLTASERRLMLAAVDVFLLNAVLLAALAMHEDFVLSWATVSQNPIYFILLTVLWSVWAIFFDCYDLPRTASIGQTAWSAGRAALLTALIYLAIPFLTPHLPKSRMSAYLFVGLATICVPLWRALYATVFVQPSFQQRLLIVGAGQSGAELARELASTPKHGNPYAGSGYRLIGFVDDDLVKADTTIEGAPVLGNRHDLQQLVGKHEIDTVVLAINHTNQIHPELFQALLNCQEQGIRLEPMIGLYERLTGKIAVEHAGHNLHVVMPPSDSPMQRVFWVTKRLIDIFASIVGLLVLALIAPCVALANAILSPGPLFYQQTRVGKGGKSFRVVKFRSMIPNAEKGCGAVWASKNDDRITPVGHFLRKTRLDEIPQFLNVLKGEMSLVGPRPERPEFVAQLMKQIPFYQARHAMRPGITGWAQVRYRYGNSVEDALIKLQYDLYYVKHQSVYLEISTIVKTAAVMLGLKGQ